MSEKYKKLGIWFIILLCAAIMPLYVGTSLMSNGGTNPPYDLYIGIGLTAVGFIISVACYAVYLKLKEVKDEIKANKTADVTVAKKNKDSSDS